MKVVTLNFFFLQQPFAYFSSKMIWREYGNAADYYLITVRFLLFTIVHLSACLHYMAMLSYV